MTTTPNYGLSKPEAHEYVSPDPFNANADIVDEELKKTAEAANAAKFDIGALPSATALADDDAMPIYNGEPKAHKRTPLSALLTWIRTKLFGTTTGLLKANGAGVISAAASGSDYETAGAAATVQTNLNTTNNKLTTVEATANGAIPKSDIGAATGGTLTVARGGTGKATHTSGEALVGAGTGAVTSRAIKNNTATSTALVANTELVTQNTLRYHTNRLTSVAAADTGYATCMARGIVLSTTDLTPGTSALTNGTLYLVYE